MFCKYCGAELSDVDKFCFSCGQSQVDTSTQPSAENSPEAPTVVPKKKNVWVRLLIAILCVAMLPLSYLAGVKIYNNSGAYEIDDNSITYHGTLEKLVKDDYNLLQKFAKKSKNDKLQRKYYIECTDFELWFYPFRDGGESQYVYGDRVTVFEEGLIEGPDPEKSAVLYRSDFEFEIKDQRPEDWHNYHTYYFGSIDDALEWLKNLEFLEY